MMSSIKNYSLWVSSCWCRCVSLIADENIRLAKFHFSFGYGWFNRERNQVRESSEYVYSRGNKKTFFLASSHCLSVIERERNDENDTWAAAKSKNKTAFILYLESEIGLFCGYFSILFFFLSFKKVALKVDIHHARPPPPKQINLLHIIAEEVDDGKWRKKWEREGSGGTHRKMRLWGLGSAIWDSEVICHISSHLHPEEKNSLSFTQNYPGSILEASVRWAGGRMLLAGG